TGSSLVSGRPAGPDPAVAIRVSTGGRLSAVSGMRVPRYHDETRAEGVHRATAVGTVTTTGKSSLSGTRRNSQQPTWGATRRRMAIQTRPASASSPAASSDAARTQAAHRSAAELTYETMRLS